jgi:hypothetical protein
LRALCCQQQTATISIEKREAKFLFELDYLPRKGGLGNAQAQRGL